MSDLIDAYLARRALDYLFGFTLSPVLWRKLPGAKSAGRVQSVALRLIVEREREIEAFRPQEYWSVIAEHASTTGPSSTRAWSPSTGKKLERLQHRRRRAPPKLPRRRSRRGASRSRASRPSRSSAIRRRRSPPRPSSRRPRENSAIRRATRCALAQNLYEAGAITYMRTDGVQMDGSAI